MVDVTLIVFPMWIVGFFSTLRREYSSPTIPRLQGPGTLLKCRLPSLCNRSFVWDAQVWHGFLGGQKGVTVFKGCLDVAVAVALALLVILSGAPLATLTKESYKILISTLGTFFRILRKPSQEFSILEMATVTFSYPFILTNSPGYTTFKHLLGMYGLYLG